MEIGDKVRFLNDVGGGKITEIRKNGIVIVEDEDGFGIPVNENDIVVIETNSYNIKQKPAPKVEYGESPKRASSESVDGKQYLKSKTGQEKEDELDENLEAKVVRLETAMDLLKTKLEKSEEALNRLEEIVAAQDTTIKKLILQIERIEKAKMAKDMVQKMEKEKQDKAKNTISTTDKSESLTDIITNIL